MPGDLSLPQDIIDTIIDILHASGDRTALKTCALVSPAFLHPCRKHLFATVNLTATGAPYKWDPEPTGPGVDVLGVLFHNQLVESPYLTQYVRSLKAHARNGFEAQWIMQSEEFPSLLSNLTRLESLELGARVAMRWAACSPALRSALISLLATSPLRRLRLQTVVGLPVSLVEQFGALTSLYLLDVPLALGMAGGGGYEDMHESANLRAVSARGSDSILEFLLRPSTMRRTYIDYSRFWLIDFQLGQHPGTYLLLSEFLAKTVSLTQLHCMLSANVDIPLFEEFLKHNQLQQVRHISFHLQDPSLLPYIYTFVSALSPTCGVEEIDVLCSLYGEQDRGLSEIMNWNSISLGLPLKQLRLRFFLEQNHSNREDHDWAESLFSTQLRPRIQDNLLHLTKEGRVKIFIHVIHYFGVRYFQEEMVRMRDEILNLRW